MMQKAMKNMRLVQMQSRLFASYNYASSSHPKVWLDVHKDGHSAGRLTFELYESHTPFLVENFMQFLTGKAQNGKKSLVGTAFDKSLPGLGVFGGDFHEAENVGFNNERLRDENLEMRHHKRGLLTMVSDGPNSNGSKFMVTFNEANYLNGY